MKKYCIALIMSTVLVFPATVFSQYYLPVGLMPMEYNSSFAGSAGNARICSSTYYSHYISGNKNRNRYGFFASYDNFLPKLRSGFGIKTSWTNSSLNSSFFSARRNDKQRTLNISAVVAPKISIKGKYTISPSLELGYNNYHVQSSTYGDQNRAFVNGFTGMASILFNASNYYIGYAARIYHSKDISWFMSYDLYSAFQFGYSFQKSADSKFSFTPQLVFPLVAYSNSIEWLWPAYNLSFRYDKFIFGLINQFPISYSTGFQLGWQKKGWRFLLSNQFENLSSPTVNFSLRYIFNQDKKSIHIMNAY